MITRRDFNLAIIIIALWYSMAFISFLGFTFLDEGTYNSLELGLVVFQLFLALLVSFSGLKSKPLDDN